MSDKNLPIKIFQKRKELDERRVEGGGGNNLPKFVLPEELLLEKAKLFTEALGEKINEFRDRNPERKFIPATLNLELNDRAIAKSHRSEIKKIFNVNNKNNFIGFNGANKLILKIENENDVRKVVSNLDNAFKYKVGISAIDYIEDFKPEIEVYEDFSKPLKVTMINYQDSEINTAVKRVFENFCKVNKVEFERTNYSPDLIIYKVKNASETTVDKIQEFEALESISFMPQFTVAFDFVDTDGYLNVKEPDPNIEYPVVGVLDSGIAKNKYLTPWLIDKKHSSYPDDIIDNSHGTFVSGIILYGDELENRTLSGLEGCKLFDATVMPDMRKETISEDELIENIREAIKENSEIKIWNMSLGTRLEADEYNFSHFGQALDNIQESYGVIICKSAGNCINFVAGKPRSRIAKSADSVHSLVVGSIAHKKCVNDLVATNNPSPFSRIGNGPSNIVKPELVSYGGNAGVLDGKLTRTGVSSISPDGRLVSDIGTSFSTPRITALLASLSMNINEEFNPLLLKSLAIHSAKYPQGLEMSMGERITNMGFGLPSPVSEIVFNDEYEISLILQDTLIKGEYMEILEFPFPQSLVDEEGYFFGKISMTIVGAPILKNQGSEYCQSDLDVKFGTYDNIRDRDTNQQTILNEIGPEGAENVFQNGAYKAAYKRDNSDGFSTERVLIDYGKKYHPVKKYSVDLSGLTPAKKESKLKGSKKWFLRVKGLYRDFTEEIAREDGEELSQSYCLILTIKDPTRQNLIYNEVSQLLSSGNFVHSNISLKEQIRVSNIGLS